MPDNTMVRATTPAGEHIKLENWPLADDAGATVRVAVAQTQLQHCVQGASGLEDGAALELRLEANRRGVKGVWRLGPRRRDGRPVRLRAERRHGPRARAVHVHRRRHGD